MSPSYHKKVDEAQDEGLTVPEIRRMINVQITKILSDGLEPEYIILSVLPYRKLKRRSVSGFGLFKVGYGGDPDTYRDLPIAELMETEEEVIRVTAKLGE